LAISLVPADLLFKYPPVLFHWPLSFESFKYVVEFDNGRFLSDMRLSALIAASTSVCVLVISGLAGYAFARLNFWGKNFLFVRPGHHDVPIYCSVDALIFLDQRPEVDE
jgi:ABC-type glycerol-3-phosphate transport system permease component